MSQEILELQEYQPYLNPDFDPTVFAKSLVSESADYSVDVSLALAKLSFNIDHLNDHIKSQTAVNYDVLVQQLRGLSTYSDTTRILKERIEVLDRDKDILREKLVEPFDAFQTNTIIMKKINDISRLLKVIQRFLVLKKRIKVQLDEEKNLSGAAYSLDEIEKLLENENVNNFEFIKKELQWVFGVREQLRSKANMLMKENLKICECVEMYYHLGEIASFSINITENAVNIVNMALTATLENNVDLGDTSVLVSRFEALSKIIFVQSSQILSVEDNWAFLIPKILEEHHSIYTETIEYYFKELKSATCITSNLVSKNIECLSLFIEPLGAVFSDYESLYLSKSMQRLSECIDIMFSNVSKIAPTREEIYRFIRAISGELEISKIDTELQVRISRNVSKALLTFIIKCEPKVSGDPSAYQCSGLGTLNTTQQANIDIVNCLWILNESVCKVMDGLENDAAIELLDEALYYIKFFIQGVVEPLVSALAKELEVSLLKLHTEFGTRKTTLALKMNNASTSQYVLEVSQKLRWMQKEILYKFQCGDDLKEWICAFGARVIRLFLRHASMIRLPSESIKLKLASDMTQVEFGLNQLFNGLSMKMEHAIPVSYQSLRAFKPALFLESEGFIGSPLTSTLPLIVSLNLLCLRTYPQILLPHLINGWNEQVFSNWVDTHSESEMISLYERSLDKYAADIQTKGEKEYCLEYPILKTLLQIK